VLLAQTTGFASLDLFEFHRSADVMLMLVIGGVGWLYGGVPGAIVFKLMQDVPSPASHRSTGRSGSACSWWCWCWWGVSA
jgi:ABC-type branched-subunit amino acid transport system permease subunit